MFKLDSHGVFALGLCLAMLAQHAQAAGGVVYGTVVGEQGPAANVTIELACPAFAGPGQPRPQAEARGMTDSRGSFSLFAGPHVRGSCQVRAAISGSTRPGEPIEVFLSESSLQYNLSLDRNGNLSMR